MVRARSWALPAGRAFLATWLGRQEPVVRQPGRAVCDEASAQRRTPRCARAVAPCWVPLWAWVVPQGEGL